MNARIEIYPYPRRFASPLEIAKRFQGLSPGNAKHFTGQTEAAGRIGIRKKGCPHSFATRRFVASNQGTGTGPNLSMGTKGNYESK